MCSLLQKASSTALLRCCVAHSCALGGAWRGTPDSPVLSKIECTPRTAVDVELDPAAFVRAPRRKSANCRLPVYSAVTRWSTCEAARSHVASEGSCATIALPPRQSCGSHWSSNRNKAQGCAWRSILTVSFTTFSYECRPSTWTRSQCGSMIGMRGIVESELPTCARIRSGKRACK